MNKKNSLFLKQINSCFSTSKKAYQVIVSALHFKELAKPNTWKACDKNQQLIVWIVKQLTVEMLSGVSNVSHETLRRMRLGINVKLHSAFFVFLSSLL